MPLKSLNNNTNNLPLLCPPPLQQLPVPQEQQQPPHQQLNAVPQQHGNATTKSQTFPGHLRDHLKTRVTGSASVVGRGFGVSPCRYLSLFLFLCVFHHNERFRLFSLLCSLILFSFIISLRIHAFGPRINVFPFSKIYPFQFIVSRLRINGIRLCTEVVIFILESTCIWI